MYRFILLLLFAFNATAQPLKATNKSNQEELESLNRFVGRFFVDFNSAIKKDTNRWNYIYNSISDEIAKNEMDAKNKERRQKVLGGNRGRSNKARGGLGYSGGVSSFGSRVISGKLDSVKKMLSTYEVMRQASDKVKLQVTAHYKKNINKTDDKAQVTKLILNGMYSSFLPLSVACKNMDKDSESAIVLDRFVNDLKEFTWFNEPPDTKRSSSIPQNEKDFIDKFGSLITRQTKFTSRYGSSNTYWISDGIAISYDNGRLNSIYQSE